MEEMLQNGKNDHIIFNVGTPRLEARNIRKVSQYNYIYY
jgi:hypothetical protein